MDGQRIQRGQIVIANFPHNCFGVVEYLKMNDGTILNSHDNVITGYGEKNTQLVIVVRKLYSLERYPNGTIDYWDSDRIPEKFDGETLIEVDPHYFFIFDNEQMNKFENNWMAKINFLKQLFNHKPQISEIKI